MKKLLLILCCTFLAATANAQITTTQLLDQLLTSMKNFDAQYICRKVTNPVTRVVTKARIVNELTFDSIYFLSSSRILTSSQDLIKNGKAAALDFNESLKRLTINYSWRTKSETIWNGGLVAEEGSKKLFEIFGKKGWKEGFTFNIGQAVPILKKIILFLPSDCDVLKQKRQVYYAELLQKYASILATPAATIANIRQRKGQIDILQIGSIPSFSNVPNGVTEAEKKLLEQWDELQILLSNAAARIDLSTLYKKAISDFEVASFKKFGYKLHWLNWNVAGGLKRFTIYDTAVVSLAKIDKDNLVRFTGTVSYNFFRESSKKRVTYFSGEVSAGNTNFLEEILPSEISTLKSTSGNSIIKEDYDALVVKDYPKLKKGYGFVSAGAVYNYFPGKIGKLGRFLGFELAGSTKIKVFEPIGVNARDLFSIKGGLLFTFENDKVAKTTFGIIASLTDIPFNDVTFKDRFGIGIRIGVPFNY